MLICIPAETFLHGPTIASALKQLMNMLKVYANAVKKSF
jgi:hypothetical protein